MSRETVYLVQAFSQGKGKTLKAEPATRCKSEEVALRSARRLAETKLGVVAFSSTGDAELGDYDEQPVVLIQLGQVPEDLWG